MLTQVFDALKVSLTVAIQHGLFAILAFSAAMVLATFFLKDVPLSKERASVPAEATPPEASTENQPAS